MEKPSLLRFAVQRVLPAARAELADFHPTGIVPAILLGNIIPLFAFGAREGNHRANIFTF